MSSTKNLLPLRVKFVIAYVLVAALAIAIPSSHFLRDFVRTVRADTTPQAPPFSQNWTNTGLITANDIWTGVPGIIGYRGDDLGTTATGTDPQTIVLDGAATPVDVNANQTDPSVFNTGGVTEFHLTDPVIALTGSGTADSPHIVVALNTTGQSGINVAYNLRDLDGSTDNAIQPVALQYRVGASGNYTNLPAGFVADASSGPSLATLITPVNVTLPVACDNQPIVHVRVLTTNAVGNDEFIGIDDISVTAGVGPTTPTLNINDVSQAETNAGTTVFTFSVTLTVPALAGGVTFDIATADGTAEDDTPATEDSDYVAQSLTGQNIPAGSTGPYIFNVTVNGDAVAEPNETFFVNVTNIVGATPGDTQGLGTISNDDFSLVPIHTIQGSGDTSPMNGAAVATSGVVTLLKSNGFFIQEPDASADADPNTSEGIFVFTSSAPTVLLGNAVSVSGTVVEFGTGGTITELGAPINVVVNSTGNPFPAPIPLTPTILDPTALPSQPQLEKFESMRMSGALKTVAPNDNFFDVDTVLLAVTRTIREVGMEISAIIPADPSSTANIPRWDENPERLSVDTNGRAGSAGMALTSNVTLGTVTGVLDFAFAEYHLIPEVDPTPSANMSAVPVPVPLPTEFTVACFNIENFANGATQRQKAARAIRQVMRYPDIIGLEEIATLTGLQALGSEISTQAVAAVEPDPMYAAFLMGTGAQNVGFLVKTTRVAVISVTEEPVGTYINPLTGLPEPLHDRPPLVLRATVDPSGPNPIPVIVVVNHPRSFIDIAADPGDGPRVRAKRKAQGESIAALMDSLQDNNPASSIMTVGDFNAFQFNDGYTDPLATIKGTPTADDQMVVDASPDVVSPDYFNLTDRLPVGERYSFVFEGTAQALDHIIINRNANARYTGYAIARFDADFPGTPASAFVNDASRPEGASDHDAPVAYFNLTTAPTAADGTVTGRITDANGVPIAGAVVNLTGTQNRKFITDANGNYRFDNVETNGFYTVRPARANYSFTPAERSFSQIGNSTEATFTGSLAGGSGNPLDTAEYFVRQHYLDFLGREPDESGFNFWSDQILGCGADAGCVEQRTINVSAAYFLSIEFQQTGGLVGGLYRASYGRRPRYAEFMPDARTIAQNIVVGRGDWEQQLRTNKRAFIDAWVERTEFRAAYDGLADGSYVDALLSHTGVSFSQTERDALVNSLHGGAATRADVLGQIAEHDRFVSAKRNEAFVMMQYFGYLRRDPDESGYAFWLNKLNQFGGNFEQAEMVKAFLVSGEYRGRFAR